MDIYIAGDHHRGWNTFLKKDPNQTNNFFQNMYPERHKLITLDTFCKNNSISRVDLIKIDVEGFETKVIEGFIKTLKNIEKNRIFILKSAGGQDTLSGKNVCRYTKNFLK